MDEIDWLKSAKKAVILFIKVFGGLAIFFAIMALLTSYKNGWEYTKAILFVSLLIGIGFPTVIGILYYVLIIFSKILNSGRTVKNFDKGYIRDLPKYCSPAISSLIYDLKIDVYKDYTATILYLCTKKYLNLVKDEDSYKIELIKQHDYSNLGRCEKYILDIIENKIKFDESQFKKEIIKEAQEKELITDKKYSKITKLVLILILIIISLIITYNINKMAFAILFGIFGATVYAGLLFIEAKKDDQNTIDFVNTEYIRTEDGKKIALLLKGLKRYMKEYTLIKEKEIDYIQILENYIPYALALDEAYAVEEFIKYNEEYRDLIYNRS